MKRDDVSTRLSRIFENAQTVVEFELHDESIALDELVDRLTTQQQQRIVERLAQHAIFLLQQALLPDHAPTQPKPVPYDSVGKWVVRLATEQVKARGDWK
jgi:hypothetical protein